MEKITYVSITEPRLENIKRNLEAVLPYVDSCLFIIGRDEQDTKDYLDSLGDKVQYRYHPWQDSFSEQYNKYLQHITEGWVLLMDDDELPSEAMLKVLKPLVESSGNGDKFCCVEFRSWSINPWDVPPKDHPDDYWRKLFFRYAPEMHYTVDLHQCLMGYQNSKHLRRNEVYYHIKTPADMARNACRNYFISGIWPSGVSDGIRGQDWKELHSIVNKRYPEVKTFSDLDSIFIKGNIQEDLKSWLVKYKNFGSNLYHELHHYFEYYFEYLHPEEYTDKIKVIVAEHEAIEKSKFSFKLIADTWSPKNDSRKLGIALGAIFFKTKDGEYKTGLVNPDVELHGFHGVESVRNDIQFAWSQEESSVTVYGMKEEDIKELYLHFLWTPKPGQKVFLEFKDKRVQVFSNSVSIRI